MAEASGPMLFARYAYPPNRLGLCGPDDAPSLRDAALAAEDREVRELARGFEGAFPYLQLIAREGGVADPLDRRVVEAYWLGGGLVSRVRPRALHRSVDDRFRRRMSKGDWAWLDMAVRGGSQPVHAFHVLEIYPRAGLMRGGEGSGPILDTMDACRIRWGTVMAVEGDQLVVRAPRLELRDGLLRIGAPQLETVEGWADAHGILGGVSAGDRVSLHWGWACDRLSERQLRRLRAWTRAAVEVANQAI
jgi:hypothetical protein